MNASQNEKTSTELLERLIVLEQRVERRLFEACRPATHRSLKQELERIQAALERIRAGTFGRCESCTTSINHNRLHFLPYAELCFSCQRSKERQETAQNTPIA